MREKGFVNLIYMGAVAIVSVLVLIGSYSRFLSAVKNRSYLSDRLPEEYKAESEINNFLSLYYQNNISNRELNLPKTEKLEKATLKVKSNSQDQQNIIEVLLKKGVVSSQYNLYYTDSLDNLTRTKIIVALPCSSASFADFELPEFSISNTIDLLVVGYAERADWLIADNGIYRCSQAVNIGNTSSPGAAMIFMNNQLRSFEGNKLAILVMATEPESVKQTLGSTCLENEDCTLCKQKALEYLSCSLADTNTKWNRYEKGNRDPSVALYTIYINQDSPSVELNESLRKFSNSSIFLDSGSQLQAKLVEIGNRASNQSYRATIEKVVD